MATRLHLFFPPFHLDPEERKLWRGEELITLREQNFAVLHYLAERAGTCVAKEELLTAIWGKFPGERSLKQCIFQLRDTLGDDAQQPRFIETISRRGYRFLAPVQKRRPTPEAPLFPSPIVVGRSQELQALDAALTKARKGIRQVVFVTGEPGLGKTTLVDAFLAQLTNDQTMWIGRGQCIEQYGQGEPYLPILEALEQFYERTGAKEFAAFLGHYAPTWLMQLPALVDGAKQEALERKVLGTTQQRMLREFLGAVEAFTDAVDIQPTPVLVFILEDLHWSDHSTLDLLAALARRRQPARLLVLGTYRPQEGMVEGHPLRSLVQELQGHALCAEIAISALDEAAVNEYLERRFPLSVFPVPFPQALYHLTGGNPLFLVTILEDLVTRGLLTRADGHWVLQGNVRETLTNVPESLRQFLTRQIEQLNTKERRLLEAASMVGLEFSSAAVAAAVDVDTVEIETLCETMAQRKHFVQAAGQSEWPDGTCAACYGFRHALYQYLWRDHATVTQRQRFQQRIGERLETAYGTQAREIAAELAVHFAEGNDHRRAVRYFYQAAMNALRRSANYEASTHLTKALTELRKLPETPDRPQQELALQTALGPVLSATQGWAAHAAGQTYSRALELGQQVGNSQQLFSAVFGAWGFYTVRAEHQRAYELTEQLVHIGDELHDSGLQVEAQWASGLTLFFLGNFSPALQRLDQSIALYKRQQHHNLTLQYNQDPEVSCLSYSGMTRWYLGYPDQALQRCQAALALARKIEHPFSLALILTNVAIFHMLRREWSIVLELAREGLAVCSEHGFPVFRNSLHVFQNLALFLQGQKKEEIAQVQKRLEGYRTLGHEMYVPWNYTLLAEACGRVNQMGEGFVCLADAFAAMNQTEERFYEAEMYRVRGELFLLSDAQGRAVSGNGKHLSESLTPKKHEVEAEAAFLTAIDVAQRQQAKMLELRAVVSLSQLWRQQGKKRQAREKLAATLDWFTEGFTTEDLMQARALFAELV